MWQEHDEDRLLAVRARQAGIRADARETRRSGRPAGRRLSLEHVSGLQLRLGRLLIVVGRTLREDESPCADPVRF